MQLFGSDRAVSQADLRFPCFAQRQLRLRRINVNSARERNSVNLPN